MTHGTVQAVSFSRRHHTPLGLLAQDVRKGTVGQGRAGQGRERQENLIDSFIRMATREKKRADWSLRDNSKVLQRLGLQSSGICSW